MIRKITSIALLTMPFISFALTPPGQTLPVGGPTTVNEVFNIFQAITYWLFVFFLAAAVLFIILAAFSYLTAAGDPEKVGKAKSRLIYAIIAIAIALVSRAIIFFIGNILNVQTQVPI